MASWLATTCRPNEVEHVDSLFIPDDWLRIRPELSVLFDVDARCVKLFERYCRQEEGPYCHHVSANYLPRSDEDVSESTLEFLVDQLCANVRCRLQELGSREVESHDKEEMATKWSPVDNNSYIIEVSACEYPPTISVTEFDSKEPNFESLIEDSPLTELAGLSAGGWRVDLVACGRTAGDVPLISIQARSADPQLFHRLTKLGFEERQQVWWKEPIAIRSLSDDSWGVVVPAPSFLPGARR